MCSNVAFFPGWVGPGNEAMVHVCEVKRIKVKTSTTVTEWVGGCLVNNIGQWSEHWQVKQWSE